MPAFTESSGFSICAAYANQAYGWSHTAIAVNEAVNGADCDCSASRSAAFSTIAPAWLVSASARYKGLARNARSERAAAESAATPLNLTSLDPMMIACKRPVERSATALFRSASDTLTAVVIGPIGRR